MFLKNKYINDKYIVPKSYLLESVKQSINETTTQALKHKYMLYHSLIDIDYLNTVLNNKLFVNRQLSFYNDNINTNLINVISDIKNNKVYDKNAVLTQFDKKLNMRLFYEVLNNLIAYDSILIFAKRPSIFINDIDYRIITPDAFVVSSDMIQFFDSYDDSIKRFTYSSVLDDILIDNIELKENEYTITHTDTISKNEYIVYQFTLDNNICDLTKIKELILAHDYVFTTSFKEVQKTSTKIHTSSEFVPAYLRDSDLIQSYEVPLRSDNTNPFFTIQQSSIRTEYQDIQKHYLNTIMLLCGLNLSALGLDSNTSNKTATQIDSENAQTVDTINNIKETLEVAFNDFFTKFKYTQFVVNLKSYSHFSTSNLIDLSNKMTLSIFDKIKMQNPDIEDINTILKMTVNYKIENAIELTNEEYNYALSAKLIDETYNIRL